MSIRPRHLGAAASLFALALLATKGAGAAPLATPTVTGAVQVTGDPSVVRAHTSPQMARNPKTGELVVVEGDIRGSRKCTVHISADDGQSWFAGGDALLAPYSDCSFHADWGPYATLAFDNAGVLYMAVEASDPKLFDRVRNEAPRHIFLARSEDSGRTWTTTMAYQAVDGDPDKGVNKGATVAVDPKNPQHVYLGWRQGTFGAPTTKEKLKTQVAASADGGRTWAPPIEVTDERGGDFPWLTVTPDGVLHVVTWTRVWPAPPQGQPNPVRELFHVSSADFGKTFSPRHVIDPGNQAHEHPPVIASDPKSGRLYVAWSAQPDANNGAADYRSDLEAYFRASSDGGQTWTDKKLLNDDPKGRANQIDPGISVAPNGRIDVAWYDSRLNPGPLAHRTETGINDVYMTYSTDGGASFAPNVRVSDRSADRSIGVWANNVDQRLNVAVTSSNTATYVAWSDTRNANREFQPEDVYAASVRFDDSDVLPVEASTTVPGWLIVGAGLAVGLGVTTLLGLFLARRNPGSASSAPVRRPALAVAGALALLSPAAAGAGAAQTVQPLPSAAVQVTANPTPVRNHSTPQIARNPKTGELVVVESDPRSQDRKCNIYISADRGRSWAPGGDPMVKPQTDCAIYAEYGPYASLAFGNDGTLYVAFVASEQINRIRNATPRSVFLARSEDSGRTFATTTVFKAPDGNEDKGLNKGAMLAVDPKDPAKVYVGWRQGIFAPNAVEKLKSNIAASADGGRTFGAPVDLTDERGGDYPGIAVSGDGVVHAVYWTRTGIASAPPVVPPPVRPLQYVSSTDGGKTYSKGVAIDPGSQRADRPALLAADPKTPNLYMVWYGNAEANNMATGFRGDLEIFFRASHDGGKTWDDRKVLNDDGPGKAHQIDPGISLAPNGRIDIAWYDGRSSAVPLDPSSQDVKGFQDVYYTSSVDHGRTFAPNVMVSDRTIDRSVGIFSNNVSSHYNIGMASTNDQAWLVWQDSRNGSTITGAEDVYAASVRLNGVTGEAAGGGTEWGASAGAVAAAVALGMGLAMVGLWIAARRPTAAESA